MSIAASGTFRRAKWDRRVAVIVVGAACAVIGLGAPGEAGATAGFSVHPAGSYRSFRLHGTHGAEVLVSANDSGVVTIVALQPSQNGLAEYVVRGPGGDRHIEARFPGGMGFINMVWKPIGRPKKSQEPRGDCKGRRARTQGGAFVGGFRFYGEGGYTEAAARKVSGQSIRTFREVCRGPDAGTGPSGSPEEILISEASLSPGRHLAFRAWTQGAKEDRFEGFEAAIVESHPRLTIRRYALAGGPAMAGQFVFDDSAKTASVRPPSPFLGSAELRDDPIEPWIGNLSVSFLGVEAVALAGPEFKARLMRSGGGLSSFSE